MAGTQTDNSDAAHFRPEAQVAANNDQTQGIRPHEFQASAGHPSFTNRRVDRFELPQLSLSDEQQQVRVFNRADTNGDQILERSEIERQLQQRGLNRQDRRLLAEMQEGFTLLSGLSTNEPGHEHGITRADMVEHRNRRFRTEHTDALQLPAERARLAEVAQGKMSRPQFEQFRGDMARFEERMKGNPMEAARTYREISRMLEPSGGTAVDTGKMGRLAMDVMDQAADPHAVKQGEKYTCTFGALESRIYTRHPSEAARLIADVATRSHYTTADGARINIDRTSANLYPNHWREAAKSENVRSHASQIFQITAANIYLDAKAGPGGSTEEYRLRVDRDGKVDEALVDYRTGETRGNNPGITIFDADSLQTLNKRITGKDEPPFVIDFAKARTSEDFRRTLDQIARDNNYPALLAVNALNEPFRPEGVNLRSGVVPAIPYHMVAIEPGTTRDTIFVNDQYGPEHDREHSIDTVYRATKLPAEVIGIPGWADIAALGFETLSKEPPTPELVGMLRKAIHEYTPEHMAAIDKAFQQRTGKPLADFLSPHLSDDSMKALGYSRGWFSNNWRRS